MRKKRDLSWLGYALPITLVAGGFALVIWLGGVQTVLQCPNCGAGLIHRSDEDSTWLELWKD